MAEQTAETSNEVVKSSSKASTPKGGTRGNETSRPTSPLGRSASTLKARLQASFSNFALKINSSSTDSSTAPTPTTQQDLQTSTPGTSQRDRFFLQDFRSRAPSDVTKRSTVHELSETLPRSPSEYAPTPPPKTKKKAGMTHYPTVPDFKVQFNLENEEGAENEYGYDEESRERAATATQYEQVEYPLNNRTRAFTWTDFSKFSFHTKKHNFDRGSSPENNISSKKPHDRIPSPEGNILHHPKKTNNLTRQPASLLPSSRRFFKLDDFEMGPVIGHGFFSEVCIVQHKRSGDKFALKSIKEVQDTSARVAFMKEVEILVTLHHPNILAFRAVFVSVSALHLLTDYLEGGTLRKLLKARDTIQITFRERWRMSLELAHAMAYLHARNILHRDLKSKNCLLSRTRTVVIADFGLAHILTRPEMKGVVGTPYWMAPEVLRDEEYGKPADIFSYGIVLCEIITRLKAEPEQIPRLKSYALDPDKFIPLCGECPQPLIDLAISCCTLEPSNRPYFSQIVSRLQLMADIFAPISPSSYQNDSSLSKVTDGTTDF